MWSFQVVPSIFFIPLLWFLFGLWGSKAPPTLPGALWAVPWVSLLFCPCTSLQNDGGRRIHQHQQDVAAINKWISIEHTHIKTPDKTKYYVSGSSQKKIFFTRVQLVTLRWLVNLASEPGVLLPPRNGIVNIPTRSPSPWSVAFQDQSSVLFGCTEWEPWGCQFNLPGPPGKCEFQINGNCFFSISFIFHIIIVREAEHTYTKKLYIVYLKIAFNWASRFNLFVCLFVFAKSSPQCFSSTISGP